MLFNRYYIVGLLASLLLSYPTLTFAIGKDKNILPQIATAGVAALSIEKERLLGDLMMRQLRSQAPVLSDPLLDDYLNDLGNRIVANADDVRYPFSFFWINSRAINAFAFFGGHIGVHTGLIANADNESELASVLAHEVAHVTQRHIARRIEAQQRNTPMTLAGIIGGVLLSMASPEAGIAAISASQAASAQFGINYTRKNEQEADVIGLKTLNRAGFNLSSAEAFFSKLAQKYRMQTKPPAFLLTHPLPESRIAEIRSRIRGQYYSRPDPKLEFHLAKARVMARYGRSPEKNVVHFSEKLTKQTLIFPEATRYALALSYIETRELEKAQTIIKQLLSNDPDNLFYLDTMTDIHIANNQPKKAVNLLEQHLQRLPNNAVVALNLANANIEAKQYGPAINILRDYLLLNPESTLAYNLLVTAYAKSERPGHMHQARAELFALLAAYPRAVDELHNAYNFNSNSPLEKKRIKARIKQLKEQQKRLKEM